MTLKIIRKYLCFNEFLQEQSVLSVSAFNYFLSEAIKTSSLTKNKIKQTNGKLINIFIEETTEIAFSFSSTSGIF